VDLYLKEPDQMILDGLKEDLGEEKSFSLNHRKSNDLGRIRLKASCEGVVSYV